MIQENVLAAFAQAIWAKANATHAAGLDLRHLRRLLESISDDIKKCTDMIVPRVSVAARTEAARLGVDLTKKGWHDQPRFDEGRRLFHREHVVPVKIIRERCLAAASTEAIMEVLQSSRVAWILKSEDRRLTSLGFRFNRPDPETAYREAGITLA